MDMTFASVIDLWPTLKDLADDAGCGISAVKQWKSRDRIPGEYWLRCELGARRRGIPNITVFTLSEIADRNSRAEKLVKQAAE